MCGIVGAIAQRHVSPILLAGLHALEYRGYDSAGLAILDEKNQLQCQRVLGKVVGLDDALAQQPMPGQIGIAHTRWATHGKPSIENAHPHVSQDEIAVVHNGIIENYESLRIELKQDGYVFNSETDTEVIAHLLHQAWLNCGGGINAIHALTEQLEGAYALAIMHVQHPDTLWVVRCGSPLVIGLGIEENFIASDQLALLPVTQKFIYLDEGDCAEISLHSIKIYDQQGQMAERAVHTSQLTQDSASKGHYRHYMQKEIFEQPSIIAQTLAGRVNTEQVLEHCFGPDVEAIFKQVENVYIVACGTSFHAGLVARYWLEGLAGISCQTEIASEFRYRQSVVPKNTLFVSLSQSGETADTLAALRKAKESDYLSTLAICNIPESSLVRESALSFLTQAGTEIGVASTKAFTTQLVALLLLTLVLKRHHQADANFEQTVVQQLQQLPQLIEAILALNRSIAKLSEQFIHKQHTLFLGRGVQYPIAMEGALKLKEISYIHAEAYAAGELKHGPLALIDEDMPVVVIAPNDDLLEKLKANLAEVRARGGQLIIFIDEQVTMEADENVLLINIPHVEAYLAPIVYTLPLQLLAYHVAVLKGTDVDQPRNLAKSVTVE